VLVVSHHLLIVLMLNCFDLVAAMAAIADTSVGTADPS
jgi:hypothetical protein